MVEEPPTATDLILLEQAPWVCVCCDRLVKRRNRGCKWCGSPAIRPDPDYEEVGR